MPKDFQDALSIIFDKGVEKDEQDTPAGSTTEAGTSAPEHKLQVNEQIISTMEIVTDQSQITEHITQTMLQQQQMIQQHSQDINSTSIPMELDEQSQYLMYGTMTDKPLVFNEVPTSQVIQEQLQQPPQQQEIIINNVDLNEKLLTHSIPTPPIQILDGDGNLTQIPGQVIEVPSVDADGKFIQAFETVEDEEQKRKRAQELDDLAMLGIDAEDLAAQCI